MGSTATSLIAFTKKQRAGEIRGVLAAIAFRILRLSVSPLKT